MAVHRVDWTETTLLMHQMMVMVKWCSDAAHSHHITLSFCSSNPMSMLLPCAPFAFHCLHFLCLYFVIIRYPFSIDANTLSQNISSRPPFYSHTNYLINCSLSKGYRHYFCLETVSLLSANFLCIVVVDRIGRYFSVSSIIVLLFHHT